MGLRSLQEQFERTTAGRILISAFLVVTLFSVISANLYPSDLKRQFFRVAKPYIYVTGVDQGWDVFAPDPRRQTIALVVKRVYADGSTNSWTIPRGGSLFGAYSDYRWRKWVELIVEGASTAELKTPAAKWVARHHANSNRKPVEVQLIFRWYDLAAPGVKPRRTEWRSSTFYTLRLDKAGGP